MNEDGEYACETDVFEKSKQEEFRYRDRCMQLFYR